MGRRGREQRDAVLDFAGVVFGEKPCQFVLDGTVCVCVRARVQVFYLQKETKTFPVFSLHALEFLHVNPPLWVGITAIQISYTPKISLLPKYI